MAGTKIRVKPYSHTLGIDQFFYNVSYYFHDQDGRVVPKVGLPNSGPDYRQGVFTGFGEGRPDRPFEVVSPPGYSLPYDRVQWVITIPNQMNTHQNSAG